MSKENLKKIVSNGNSENHTVSAKSEVAKREEEILKFWKKNRIFEKTLEKPAKGEYVFYDGPPFATGVPHYGHILASAIKDAVPRYQTMRGKKVGRRWGWDCHGLPIENIVEKDLKISGRKQIEEFGVEKFNEYARSKVLTFVGEWKKTVDRMGRWVDFDGSYKTMDNTFIESVWWALGEINKKGLVYEGTRVLPYCPRCETPISNSEIAMDNSYKDISDISVYVKFELADEPGTYVLAWTTTPWTLPGNFALAVNPDIDYVKVEGESLDGKKEFYILSAERFEALKPKFKNPKIIETFKGKKLVGKSYKPLFDYFTDKDFKNKNNAWKIYGAGFVTTTDGTGVVHVAPGYGEDDMELSKKENIPFVHHVGTDGKFNENVGDLAGIPVKPKGDHKSADILILKKLSTDGKLFAKETITHSYPHCHRCETPLYYYAIPSWFIKISEIKKKLLSSNNKINWVPAHLKEGRYAKSLEGAPDWNISRNRFWASPLPIWKCDSCKKVEFIGSLSELKEKVSHKNKYFTVRHGESESNVREIINSSNDNPIHLTEKGKKEAETAGKKLKKEKIDFIYASPLFRTKETAEIIAEALNIPKEKIIFDDRLRELGGGVLDSHPNSEYRNFFSSEGEKFLKAPEKGENLSEMKKRVGDFIYETEEKNSGKNILIVSHEYPIWMLASIALGADIKNSAKIKEESGDQFIKTGEVRELNFAPIPHNPNYELDFHRPYSDRLVFACPCGKGDMKRIPEVIDGWFESGSMPFAPLHYPFENEKFFKSHFPGDFVAEYIAQTRTWFYYSHVVSEILFKNIPFKNIVTTGTILAEDGQKMSKSKGNYPDPWLIFNKYGVDALRYYLLSSSVMKSEDLFFSEKDVDAVYKKIITRLDNVVSFYEMYKTDALSSDNSSVKSPNILDKWILTRLCELENEITQSMENYEISRAVNPIEKFIEDLSVWYLRRSRDRFKSADAKDKAMAVGTMRIVLKSLAKVMAPFTPFLAEEVYQKVKTTEDKESVHLEDWPKLGKADKKLLETMTVVRKIVSLGLEARAKAGIKVRQPLNELRVKDKRFFGNAEIVSLVKDELNVKNVSFGTSSDDEVSLDTLITPALKEEGDVREIIRAIQDLRKKEKLNPSQKIGLEVFVSGNGVEIFTKNEENIKNATLVEEIKYLDKKPEKEGAEIILDDIVFKFCLI